VWGLIRALTYVHSLRPALSTKGRGYVRSVSQALIKGGKMIKKLRKILALDNNEKRASKEEFMQLVQKKAYELYEERGCQAGNDLEDWITAERLVKEDLGIE